MNKIILITLMSCLISCNTKQDNSLPGKTETNKKLLTRDNMEIEKILERQLKAGGYSSFYDTDYAFYKYDKSDLEVTLNPIKKILINHGYKIIPKDIFISKIKTVFGNINRYEDIFYINGFDKCAKPKSINYYDPDGFRNDLYFSTENRIVLNLYSLPEIIDYQKDYKEIAAKEDKFPTVIAKEGDDEKIYLTKWKDIPDLAKQRQKNIDLLINRNKYLFNDSKANLVWLKFYDKEFLESLVKTFGYVKDQDLLKWVLDRNLIKIADTDLKEFGKILWTKTCDNNIIVHKEVFDLIAKQDKTAFKNYNLSLRVFAEDFKDDNLSFSEVAKIKALVCYYGTKMTDDNLFSYFFNIRDQKYEEEFKKNNYYNLPDFKEIYELTRKGGISLPGENE